MSNSSEKPIAAPQPNIEESNEDSEDLRRSSRRKKARVGLFSFNSELLCY